MILLELLDAGDEDRTGVGLFADVKQVESVGAFLTGDKQDDVVVTGKFAYVLGAVGYQTADGVVVFEQVLVVQICIPLPDGVNQLVIVLYALGGLGVKRSRFGIVNGGCLTISGSTTMSGNGIIRVCEGGSLIVDGGTIQNANLVLVPGCTVIIRNGGVINMAPGKSFDAPIGATVNIESGIIN